MLENRDVLLVLDFGKEFCNIRNCPLLHWNTICIKKYSNNTFTKCSDPPCNDGITMISESGGRLLGKLTANSEDTCAVLLLSACSLFCLVLALGSGSAVVGLGDLSLVEGDLVVVVTVVAAMDDGTTDDAIVVALLADDAVVVALLADDAVVVALLADDAVVVALLADDAVVVALLADDAVVVAVLADDAVVVALLADDAVVVAVLADDAVVVALLADDAVVVVALLALLMDFTVAAKVLLLSDCKYNTKHGMYHTMK